MSKLRWYIHRLRAMPPAEILMRLRHAAHSHLLLTFGPPRHLSKFDLPPTPRVALNFPKALDNYLQREPERWQRIATRAKSPNRHRWSLLGAPERDFGCPVDWQCDPLTGKRWPAHKPAMRLDHRHAGELGEVKYVWELGRMPWLLPWALAARALADGELARQVIEEIVSFVRANPPYQGVHWTSGIELAVRVVNWTWALALIAPIASPTPQEWREIGGYVALCADYCRRFLSLYSSANNHLIAEGVALEVAGLAWPWLPAAKLWAQWGRKILDCEIPRQILPDGGSIEMCPAYLREVLVWSLAAARVRAEHTIAIPDAWRERWLASADLLETLCAENEPLPSLGDDDEGDVLPTGHHPSVQELAHVLRLCAAPATALARPQRPLPLLALLVAPPAALGSSVPSSEGRFNAAAAPVVEVDGSTGSSPHQSRARFFPHSGLLVIRGKHTRLVADFGPHGMPPIYAHAHADALSLTLDVDGCPALIDPGTYCYHGQRQWRDYFRSTRAHNTIELDGRNQSQMLGPFLWGRIAHTIIVAADADGITFTAEHDGYFPVIHRRTISSAAPDEYLVIDELYSPRSADANKPVGEGRAVDMVLWWHFAPGEVELDNTAAQWKTSRHRVALAWQADTPLRASIHEGETSPPQGWYSPAFSVKVPAPALALRARLTALPLRITTTIRCLPC